MIPIFVASHTGFAGRTLVSLGLALKLIEQGFSIGYLKPIGMSPVKKGDTLYDADALFVKETLELEEAPEVISPYVQTYEHRTLLFQGAIDDVRPKIRQALDALRKKDFVIIGGPNDLFAGALLGIDALSLVRDLKARVLLVEAWHGGASADVVFGMRNLFAERFCGSVINKVPPAALQLASETVRPFLETRGVPVFGVFAKDRMLEAVTVRQLNDILSGTVLCCEDKLDEFVENFSVGAMDVDSALQYFRRLTNKAVITGAHRSDIQLAAMETSTRCIILTGGLMSNDVVIGKAQAKGIPILSVPDDTYTTIEKIEAQLGRTNLREMRKVARVKELMDAEFDMTRFLRLLRS